jgi:hypothetical protein
MLSLSTVQLSVSGSDSPDIGYATGGTCWVVDKSDHNKLTPIGTVGGLLIDCPTVSRD